METAISHDQQETAAQAFLTPEGKKLLLVNKRNHPVEVVLPQEAAHAMLWTVDEATGEEAPRKSQADGTTVTMAPFAVTVATWPSAQ